MIQVLIEIGMLVAALVMLAGSVLILGFAFVACRKLRDSDQRPTTRKGRPE